VAGGLEPELGGTTVAILNYVRSSVAADVESHLLVTVDDPESAGSRAITQTLVPHGATVWPVSRTGRFEGRAGRWGMSAPLVWWLMRSASGFDVIVLHGAWLFSSLAALIAGRITGKPCAMIPHESLTTFDVKKKGSRTRVLAKSVLGRLYARSCRLFVFSSDLECRDSLPGGTRARKTVVPCPLFDDSVPLRQRPTIQESRPLRIGFLGRLDPKKNLNVLIQAMPLVSEDVTLVVGGDGHADFRRGLLEEAARLGVHNRIEWRGFVDASEKDAFFESIDVLVMPSAYESFGIVAAEAMLRGVPAIVSPRTGVAALIEQHGGGLIVEPLAEELASVLSRLDRDRSLMTELAARAPEAAAPVSFSHVGSRLREEYFLLAS